LKSLKPVFGFGVWFWISNNGFVMYAVSGHLSEAVEWLAVVGANAPAILSSIHEILVAVLTN